MLNDIAFIGGIHGVGKSTICRKICDLTGLVYLSASDVLKWEEINNDKANKSVVNVSSTQTRLIKGLTSIVKPGQKYLLDGHFCLLGVDGTIKKIPRSTFYQINPISLNVITDSIANIKAKLEKRDNKEYDSNLLNNMQEMEISYAQELSEDFRTKLTMGNPEDFSEIIKSLSQLIT